MIGIEVLTIGGEILSGQTVDTNFLFLARGLRMHGLDCRWHTTVADDRETLSAALEIALSRATVVITTGGLGPTPDDITRKVLASVLNRQLILREDLVGLLEERYTRMGRRAPASLQAQALIPFGADLIENTIGTAPGLRLQTKEGRVVYALPGVPREMETMAERFVLPEVSSLIKGPRLCERTLRTVGVPESTLHSRISGSVPSDVGVAYLPHLGEVDLKFSLRGPPRTAEAHLRSVVETVRELLGDVVYGEGVERLEEVLGVALLDQGWRIGLAESLTGGGIGASIVRVPGASRYFLGDVVAYSNEAKEAILGVPAAWIRDHGAVSAPVAEAMAHGARERFGANVGLATTGIAGPDGGTAEKPVGLVYFGASWPGGRFAARRLLTGDRHQVIERARIVALDLARRAVAGLEIETGI